MTIAINGTDIDRVGVVDDSADARDTLSDELKDADVVPRPFDGPFSSLHHLLQTVSAEADAVVCDHHLTPRNYAPCTGAEAVGGWYQKKFPSVLVTRYEKAELEEIRRFRRQIPSLIPSEEACPETIIKGLEICIGEFHEHYLATRKPWPNMFRIDDVEESSTPIQVYVVIPGWNASEVITLPIVMFPQNLHEHVRTDERFFAIINMGAENQEDLYFDSIEYRGK